ncbi:hypothetical protein NE850_18520 [Paraburkholderia sp. USG1]|uniref:hypothetical protein n=1 Tax=Paraburkholderia sp. USG1 TaxID=2952268 RepID=UPI002860D331|nr:hypothetical protein [Paraburkholderia sp. USG1]MDR8398340.1 hypothetical protein [Paraburkholderia sp. USG1]
MVLPDYLTIPVTNENGRGVYLVGETGMTLREAQWPASPLAGWLNDDRIPGNAREVLEADARLAGITGLIRVLAEQEGANKFRAVWVLARVPGELVSVVVRDARDASHTQLQDDARFSISQARRYWARNAIVLVQSQSEAQSLSGLHRFVSAFDQPGAERDRLYRKERDDDIGLSYAWLSPDRMEG